MAKEKKIGKETARLGCAIPCVADWISETLANELRLEVPALEACRPGLEALCTCADWSHRRHKPWPSVAAPRTDRPWKRRRKTARTPLKEIAGLLRHRVERRLSKKTANWHEAGAECQPQHAAFIESLDLQNAMPRLGSVLLPSGGWSAPCERQRLLANLGALVSVSFEGPARAKGDGTLKRLAYDKKKEASDSGYQLQVCDAPSASVDSSNMLGLPDLIPNWKRASEKDRRDLHKLLRDAVAEGRLPPRRGQRWEWDCFDPALAVAREVFTAAGLMSTVDADAHLGAPGGSSAAPARCEIAVKTRGDVVISFRGSLGSCSAFCQACKACQWKVAASKGASDGFDPDSPAGCTTGQAGEALQTEVEIQGAADRLTKSSASTSTGGAGIGRFGGQAPGGAASVASQGGAEEAPPLVFYRRLRVLWGIDGAEDEPARKRARRSTAQKPMGPTKLAKASKAFALSMTPSSSSGEAYVMPEPEVDIFGLACADAGRCLLVWLGFADCCWLRAASRSAASVVRYVTWLRCREFVYDPIEFEPRFQKGTRSGRVRPMSQDAVSRRLVLFLRQPRHAFFIESLDLTLAPMPALESAELHEALRGAMPRLGSVLLPTDGWSAPAERKRLLANLAEAVEVAWDGAGPKTSKKKEPECSDGDGGRSSLSQVGDASSASTVGSPVRSPEHSRARSRSASAGRLGLQDLIPNWSRLSAKDRGSVFRELREAVANGRLPPRQGPCRWEWDRDDPALAVARDACVAAGVSRA
eukprot:s2762_g2.t1